MPGGKDGDTEKLRPFVLFKLHKTKKYLFNTDIKKCLKNQNNQDE